jgi:DNA-binding transcriptional regulator YiaG
MCSVGVVELSQRDLDDIRLARVVLRDGEGEALRESAQLQRSELAAAVGATADAVALWEAGKRVPRTEAALQLGRLYRRIQARAAAA